MHVDLMGVLSGGGASRWIGLGDLSRLLDLPAKSFIDDEPILRGEERRVADLQWRAVSDELSTSWADSSHRCRFKEQPVRVRNGRTKEGMSCAAWSSNGPHPPSQERFSGSATVRRRSVRLSNWPQTCRSFALLRKRFLPAN